MANEGLMAKALRVVSGELTSEQKEARRSKRYDRLHGDGTRMKAQQSERRDMQRMRAKGLVSDREYAADKKRRHRRASQEKLYMSGMIEYDDIPSRVGDP